MAVASQQAQSLPQTSLYVGDLHPLVSEALLYSKFGEIGNVLSVRICRDLATRNSLGYGYVNFEDPKDAERALENLNYEPLMGRPIRLMWSQRDPSLRKSGRGNIFIKNLEKGIEQKELYDTFGFFGRILSCKIAMDEHGNSKGYGFVHFEKEECAERAIEKINGMLIRERVVYVGKFIPSSDRKSTSGKMRFNNIYVKNFPPETTDEKLREMFSEFGEIKSCCVEKDSEGKSKGFGFVCFQEPDHAEQAVKTMHGKEINGRALYANRAQRKEERQEELKQRLEKQRAERQSKYVSGVNLYVKNLDDNINDEELKKTFCKYGPITSAKVMTDASGRSKGFGFVCFTQPEQAARAVTEMNTTIVGSKPLYVALAQRKEDRRAKLIAEHQQRMAHFRNSSQMMSTAAAHAPAPSYFPPAAFQQPQRYYPTSAVLSSQPRWNRAAGLSGVPTQIGGGVPARAPIPGHYLSANPAAGMTPNPMAAMAQMRTAGVGRPMVPSGMPSMPGGPHMQASAMMNPAATQQRHQAAGRPAVPIQQVMAPPSGPMPPRPSMASVVAATANANPNVRTVAPQVPRAVIHPGLGGMAGAAGNVRFNQTARNVANQPAPAPTMSSVLAPLGDQNSLTVSALAQLSEEDQKRTLGERLFPLVQEIYPSLAQKLTGMLLGVDNAEVIHLLESKESLRAKLEEGISVLRNSRNLPPDLAEEAHVASSESMGINSAPGQNGDGSTEAGKAEPKTEGVKPEDS
ncbi:Polyadenylate-binding protein [Fasciola hepatica]|uniref:Polyadenylate-binding protein n=1 Tax=Fasciola hepatica TaxID=6192 RepID=A0A4E0QZA4_FASHE|nr:Polyadenylate-binding protein [Fasciola hepatica]